MKKDQKQNFVGLISVGVPWFDVAIAKKNLEETRAWLQNSWSGLRSPGIGRGYRNNWKMRWKIFKVKIARMWSLFRSVPSRMAKWPLTIAERLGVPVIIHSLPEPDINKQISINSLCGANLSTFTLNEMDIPHKAIHGSVS